MLEFEKLFLPLLFLLLSYSSGTYSSGTKQIEHTLLFNRVYSICFFPSQEESSSTEWNCIWHCTLNPSVWSPSDPGPLRKKIFFYIVIIGIFYMEKIIFSSYNFRYFELFGMDYTLSFSLFIKFLQKLSVKVT